MTLRPPQTPRIKRFIQTHITLSKNQEVDFSPGNESFIYPPANLNPVINMELIPWTEKNPRKGYIVKTETGGMGEDIEFICEACVDDDMTVINTTVDFCCDDCGYEDIRS